jgi:hypothetical protein
MRLALTCPATPQQGCAGRIHADVIARRGGRRVGDSYLHDYRIPAGTTATFKLELLRRVKSRRALAARIEQSSMYGGTSARKRVLVRRG